VDKTTLEFFKIDEAGLIDGSTPPGTWASDKMIANNNTWVITIPSDISPGNYVRHETIALHSAGSADGAQSYPQCINLEITGSGTTTPTGVLGTALMTATDPGILISIYHSLTSYIIPGPAIYSSAGGSSQTGTISATSTTSTVVQSSVASSQIASSLSTITPDPTKTPVQPISASFGGYQNSTRTHRPGHPSKPTNGGSTKSYIATSVTSQVSETVAPSPIIETISVVPIPVATSATQGNSPTKAATTSITNASAIAADTTLSQVLSWISSFYSTHQGKAYTGESTSLARRHARDIIA